MSVGACGHSPQTVGGRRGEKGSPEAIPPPQAFPARSSRNARQLSNRLFPSAEGSRTSLAVDLSK